MCDGKLGIICIIRGGAWGRNSTWLVLHSLQGSKGFTGWGKTKSFNWFPSAFPWWMGNTTPSNPSDKDFSEINAYSNVFPSVKHQLCFWHCLHAVKKCLAVNHWQPGFYHIGQARVEFPFIHEYFLPLTQRGMLPEPQVFKWSHSYYIHRLFSILFIRSDLQMIWELRPWWWPCN